MSLPYLNSFPGIGGVIKQRPEDFFVQELPLYEPGGEGEHVYVEVQKVGLSTFDAINRLADLLHVSSRDIGFAGMKDAQAVTRQIFSIHGTTEERAMSVRLPNLAVQWAVRHGNKLRLGHLSGNRFAIKIREVNPTDVVKLQPVVEELQRRGLPNFFGEQRFGRRDNNDQLGAALVRSDNVAVLRLLLGTPDRNLDDPQQYEARAAFDRRDNEAALHKFPRHCGMERRILARLIKAQKAGSAVRAIDEKLRRLWVSALQSRVFNDVLARRVGSIDRLMDGDLAYKHENGACFTVGSAAAEQARCEAWEISPTGPLVGYRMTWPHGEPGAIEHEVLDRFGLKPEMFKQHGRLRVKGARRPLRVRPADVTLAAGVDEHGGHITVAFTLPPGAFATVLLRELMKNDAAAEIGSDGGSGSDGFDAASPGGDEAPDAEGEERDGE